MENQEVLKAIATLAVMVTSTAVETECESCSA